MDKQTIRAWYMYDWANSAFATTIMAAVMPIYFSKVASQGLSETTATAFWGYTQSIALVLIVILSPILGAIADKSHSKKTFLRFFTYLGVAASIFMYTIDQGEWIWACILVTIGTLGFSGANVFYDAFLTDLAPERERDMISSRGYAYGYIGGGLLLTLNLIMILKPEWFYLTSTQATQLSFLSVGIWWFVFSIPIFRHVHEPEKNDSIQTTKPLSLAVDAFKSVGKTIRKIHEFPELIKFLIAFWFFNDGINTIIKMATIYGAEIGIGETHLIAALLITQFVGIPCTLLFGRVANKLGAKMTLMITLGIYLIIVTLGYFMKNQYHFYALASMVAFVQGGSQALSRSIFSRMVPKNHNAEFFGFFGLSGKFSSIFGPALFGLVAQSFGSSRSGIISLALFFIIGMIILVFVNIEKGKMEAIKYEQAE
ncbi:MFS transporter [Thermoflavimicrobium dichotomicum]|uniref:MFS transporter, UMF1 family n=1 Tax=Thermoflavimicrobium dichotomicum TaxID=46223 RepID=A0A1I3QR76_9BACL|nr:MFS transporter [Thermoflavimicrobium dichotomicum]SFJ36743.1 MFS transporter, UMF1 family [Thermoflavimicrobium dichotomicum]